MLVEIEKDLWVNPSRVSAIDITTLADNMPGCKTKIIVDGHALFANSTVAEVVETLQRKVAEGHRAGAY